MGFEHMQQVAAFCGAASVGLVTGVMYDVMRALRRRVRQRAVSELLDLLFWVLATAALFYFVVVLGGGELRIFMVLAALLGAVVYFKFCSALVLELVQQGVDGAIGLVRICLLPLGQMKKIVKRMARFAKKLFLSWEKWCIIKVIPEGARFRARKGKQSGRGARQNADEAGGICHENRGFSPSDLHGDGAAEPAGENPRHRARGPGADEPRHGADAKKRGFSRSRGKPKRP